MAGGKSDSVGVVPEPVAKQAAVVVDPVPTRPGRYAGFPWNSHKRFDVPWTARTYTFDLVDGGIAVLPVAWTIEKDQRGRVSGFAGTKPEGDDPNSYGYPELTYKQAKAMQELSASTRCSLKVAFAKIVGTDDLSKADLDKLALAPDKYAAPDVSTKVESDKKSVADAFWKAVKA